jgi:hypothetical protein
MVYEHKGEVLIRPLLYAHIPYFSLSTLVSLNLNYDEIIEFIKNLNLILGDLTHFIKDTFRN